MYDDMVITDFRDCIIFVTILNHNTVISLSVRIAFITVYCREVCSLKGRISLTNHKV